VTATPTEITQRYDTLPMGFNAVIQTNVASVEGSVTGLEIIKSGVAFQDQEGITFSNTEISSTVGMGIADVEGIGKSQGYYSRQGGVLSGAKKLFDGHYYQEFSYDVISNIQLKKYEESLRNIVHMAGYALFGTFESEDSLAMELSMESTEGKL
jgi:hypothetical protein